MGGKSEKAGRGGAEGVSARGISRSEEVIMREHSLIYTNHRLPTLGRPTSTWRGRPLAEGPRDLYERLTYSLGGGRILLAFYLVSSRQIISEILSSGNPPRPLSSIGVWHNLTSEMARAYVVPA